MVQLAWPATQQLLAAIAKTHKKKHLALSRPPALISPSSPPALISPSPGRRTRTEPAECAATAHRDPCARVGLRVFVSDDNKHTRPSRDENTKKGGVNRPMTCPFPPNQRAFRPNANSRSGDVGCGDRSGPSFNFQRISASRRYRSTRRCQITDNPLLVSPCPLLPSWGAG